VEHTILPDLVTGFQKYTTQGLNLLTDHSQFLPCPSEGILSIQFHTNAGILPNWTYYAAYPQFNYSLWGQHSSSFSVRVLGDEQLLPRALYWDGLADSSSSPVESGIWYTSTWHGKGLHFLGNVFVMGAHPGDVGAWVGVARCRVKVRGQVSYLTKFQQNAIFTNPHKSRGFSPCYPPFHHESLLSHWLLFCYHPPTQLSDYQYFLLFQLILLIHGSCH